MLRKAVFRRYLTVLGIETSCDDTSVAIVNDRKTIKSLVTKSQFEIHQSYKGIVPSLAAIQHRKNLPLVLKKALEDANFSMNEIDLIAATRGPGMAPCLSVGLNAGKALAAALNKPFIGVNHMEAHALTARLEFDIRFPFLCLLISGGHTLLLIVKNIGDYLQLGTTVDDSLGESFDKVANMLEIDWLPNLGPGPALEAAALDGDEESFQFTVPFSKKGEKTKFSFSGLKTAVLREVESKLINQADGCKKKKITSDIAASFQKTATLHITKRVKEALIEYNDMNLTSLVVSGGVARNVYIRTRMNQLCKDFSIPCFFPSFTLCTDNAAMIAWTGVERSRMGKYDSLQVDVVSKWPLEDMKLVDYGIDISKICY